MFNTWVWGFDGEMIGHDTEALDLNTEVMIVFTDVQGFSFNKYIYILLPYFLFKWQSHEYTLVVRATDHGKPPRSSTANVKISIASEASEPPKLSLWV